MAFAIAVAASGSGCGDSSGPSEPEPAALIVAGGQNAAFPGDTFPLTTWFTDADGTTLGIPASGAR